MRKTALLTAAAVTAFVLAAAFVVPWITPVDRAARALMSDLSELTGMPLRASDRQPVFRLLPRPALTITAVEAGPGGDATGLSARSITLGLRLLPLLTGSFRAHTITIEGLTLHADTPGARESLAAIAARSVAAARRTADGTHPTRIILSDATVIAGSMQRSLVFTDVEGDWRWGASGEAVALAASGRLRGQRFAFSLSGPTPDALVEGGRAPIVASFTAAPATLSVRGILTGGARPFAQGKIEFASPSLRELAAWLDLAPSLPAAAGKFAVSGTGRLDENGLDLSPAELRIGEDALEGTFGIRLAEGVPAVTATLAATQLDLTPLLSVFGRGRADHGQVLPVTLLQAIGLDLRLSASRVQAGDMVLDELALAAVLRRGRLELTIGRAQAGGGTMRFRATAQAADRGLELKANATFTGVELSSYIRRRSSPLVTGLASGTITIDAAGPTVDALMDGLLGSVDITVNKGEIAGIDLAALAKRISEGRGVESPVPAGRTPFAALRVAATVWNGVTEIKTVAMSGPGFQATLLGAVALGTRRLDLTGRLAVDPPASRGEPAVLRIVGPWRNPAVTLGPDAAKP